MFVEETQKTGEYGGTLIEFVVVATMFFVMLIAICAAGNLYFTHNALVETTRRGARFASMQAAHATPGTPRTTNGCDTTGPALNDIKNYTIYGNIAGTGPKLVDGLSPDNICVEYGSTPLDPSGQAGFGIGQGTVSVSIINYDFHFVVPFIAHTITMPAYRSTVTGESAGVIP